MKISDYYFKEIDGKTIESRFRFKGTSLLEFFEWMDCMGILDNKEEQKLKSIQLLGRMLIRRIRYLPDKKATDILATAVIQEEFYDIEKDVFKIGTMFEPIGQYLDDYQIIDIPYNHDIMRAKGEYIPLDAFLILEDIPGLLKDWNHYITQWNLVKDAVPEEIFKKGEIYFKYCALIDIINISCYIHLFSKKNAKAYVTFDTFNSYGLRGIIAAKHMGMRTIGIQCGLFIRHSERMKDKNSAKVFPFTDVYLAWGNTSKKRLIKETNFPKERIIVMGSTRYDGLYHKLNKEKISK